MIQSKSFPACLFALLGAAALACAYLAHALPIQEDPNNPDPRPRPPPPESCVPTGTGTLTATPAVLDLLQGMERVGTTLSWTTSITRSCTPFRGFVLETPAHEPYAVDLAGNRNFTLNTPGTHTYTLKLLRNGSGPPSIVATATVVVREVSVLSAGNLVAPQDIDNFDHLWMQPQYLANRLIEYRNGLPGGSLDWGWQIGADMQALVDMYEVTRDDFYRAESYVKHLSDIIDTILPLRDDRRTNPPAPLDTFRPDWPTPMPLWGKSDADSGYYWTTSLSLDLSGAMLYSMAAFARIVAEDPRLQNEQYKVKALQAANAVLESFEAYYPRWQTRMVDGLDESYLQSPPIMSQFLTHARCDAGGSRQCYDNGDYAGNKEPHNVNHNQLMAAIELYRVISNPFYQQSREYRSSSATDRMRIGHLVRSNQRFFENALQTTHMRGHDHDLPPPLGGSWGPARLVWGYMVDSFRPHIEDISHGEVAMRYLGLLHENQDYLNMTNWVTLEQLALFANTFVYNVAPGDHFARNVAGQPLRDGDRNRDAVCAGWLSLARADSRVYEFCAGMTLRLIGNQRPNLGPVQYAALLKHKRFRDANARSF